MPLLVELRGPSGRPRGQSAVRANGVHAACFVEAENGGRRLGLHVPRLGHVSDILPAFDSIYRGLACFLLLYA